jgi:probable F420-dependent oxidoreductase
MDNQMHIGIIYPQTEFGSDPIAIRDFAQTAEELGYHHILVYDHVLGANPERPGGWSGPYTYRDAFMEPFVLFSYLAAHTRRIRFTTGILILPQRQTALVAKQAATLDVLSGGRLRLGVGLGWNRVEYTALNQDFHTRGARITEQVLLLRQLWTQPLVNFEGKQHSIPDAGILPLPVQQPIPIWFGGHAEAMLKRAARLADGWMPNYRTPVDVKPSLERLEALLEENGRRLSDFGLECRMAYGNGDPAVWQQTITGWQNVGATHLTVNLMGCGLEGPSGHIEAVRRFASQAGVL